MCRHPYCSSPLLIRGGRLLVRCRGIIGSGGHSEVEVSSISGYTQSCQLQAVAVLVMFKLLWNLLASWEQHSSQRNPRDVSLLARVTNMDGVTPKVRPGQQHRPNTKKSSPAHSKTLAQALYHTFCRSLQLLSHLQQEEETRKDCSLCSAPEFACER